MASPGATRSRDHRTAEPAPAPRRPAIVAVDRPLSHVAGELLLAVTVAALVSLPVQWVFARLPIPVGSYVPTGMASLAYVVLGLAVVALLRGRSWRLWRTSAAVAVLSLLTTVSLGTTLLGTRHYLGGVVVDQQFRVEYLTRMTNSASLSDYAYADLPSFYSAGWFWLGGRFADLLGLEGWAAYKPWAILSMAVTAAIAFVLWSLVVTRRQAVLLALVTALVGLVLGAAEPYSWFASATIPPLLVIAWRLLTALRLQEQAPTARPGTAEIVLGVFLGVFGATYTLLWGFSLWLLGLAALLTVALAVRDKRTGGPDIGPLLRAVVLRGLGILAVTGSIMLLVWAPFLLAVLGGEGGPNLAARYLPPNSAALPTPMTEFSVQGALCLAGLVWLVLNVARRPLAQALALGVAGAYGWFLLSQVMLAFETTLLAFRVIPALVTMLSVAAVLGAVELYEWAVTHGPAAIRTAAGAAALALGAAVGLTLLYHAPEENRSEVDLAFSNYYPTGVRPDGTRDLDDLSAWLPDLADTVQELSGREPEEQILLTDAWTLLSVQPYYSFQASTPHYANPLAHFDERRAAVASWAAATSPEDFVEALDQSRFQAPNVFVLREGPDGRLHINLSADAFPRQPNVQYYDVPFDPALFRSPEFAVEDVGPYTVAVRR